MASPEMAAVPQAEEEHKQEFPAGMRFLPTDEELIVNYLQPKINNLPFPRGFIADVQVYDLEPKDLLEKGYDNGTGCYYFFTPTFRKYPKGMRPQRSTPNGFWRATTTEIDVKDAQGRSVGRKRTLNYYIGKSSAGNPNKENRTSWTMKEFKLPNSSIQHTKGTSKLDNWVLVKVYQKTLKKKEQEQEQENEHQQQLNNLRPVVQERQQLQQSMVEIANNSNSRESFFLIPTPGSPCQQQFQQQQRPNLVRLRGDNLSQYNGRSKRLIHPSSCTTTLPPFATSTMSTMQLQQQQQQQHKKMKRNDGFVSELWSARGRHSIRNTSDYRAEEMLSFHAPISTSTNADYNTFSCSEMQIPATQAPFATPVTSMMQQDQHQRQQQQKMEKSEGSASELWNGKGMHSMYGINSTSDNRAGEMMPFYVPLSSQNADYDTFSSTELPMPAAQVPFATPTPMTPMVQLQQHQQQQQQQEKGKKSDGSVSDFMWSGNTSYFRAEEMVPINAPLSPMNSDYEAFSCTDIPEPLYSEDDMVHFSKCLLQFNNPHQTICSTIQMK